MVYCLQVFRITVQVSSAREIICLNSIREEPQVSLPAIHHIGSGSSMPTVVISTTYRVSVEGLSAEGIPFTKETFIEVD